MANSDPTFIAFGLYLKAMRIQMGFPLPGIARHIRVSERQLGLIEAEDHSQLPDPIYVKGILRAYARCIGVDEEDIIDRYVLNRALYEEKQRPWKKQWRPGKIFNRPVLAGGLVIIIVLLIYMMYGVHTISFPLAGKKSPEIPGQKNAPGGKVSTRNFSIDTNGKLFLRIDAVEDTWLKIILDDDPPIEYLLHPMDHLEMAASSSISMRIGNAGGVKVFLNEEPVTIAGETGQVVDVTMSHSN